MKKFLISLLLMLPLAFSANAQQKIGVVNTSAIMEALPDVKAATTKIQDLAKQYDSEIKRMQDELKVKLEAYQKEEASMTDVIKKRRQQELQEMESRTQNSYQMMQEEIQKEGLNIRLSDDKLKIYNFRHQGFCFGIMTPTEIGSYTVT